MKNIFSNENYILCKVGYSMIQIMELETGNKFYFEKQNTGGYSFKGMPATAKDYPNLLDHINSMNLKLIEKTLWKNIEEPFNENLVKYVLSKIFPSERFGLSTDLCYLIQSIEKRSDIIQYLFENKIKPEEMRSMIKKGLLHYISKKHVLNKNFYNKSYKPLIGKIYVNFN